MLPWSLRLPDDVPVLSVVSRYESVVSIVPSYRIDQPNYTLDGWLDLASTMSSYCLVKE